jgi:hypothetical protein
MSTKPAIGYIIRRTGENNREIPVKRRRATQGINSCWRGLIVLLVVGGTGESQKFAMSWEHAIKEITNENDTNKYQHAQGKRPRR